MFHPHGWCYLWEPPLVALHVGSDALTALAYFAIGLALALIVRRRRDLPFGLLFALSGAFIFLCGLTHLASILVVWQPLYWIEGLVKAATALVSVATAVVAIPSLPLIMRIPNPLVDPLTGIATRGALFESVQKKPASMGPAAVLYIDLDHFKDVNDKFGHACGDLVLREAARRLKAVVRPRDIVARLGGDEFALVLTGASLADGERIAAQARTALAAPVSVNDGRTVWIGASIGVAELNGDFDAALRAADRAMYAAKHDGRVSAPA
ncbi:MAG: Ethylene response sensor [Candidatus Eremiobacteraeota bacterium]|nr:Ethylene response sensor [Candidatus Eremiobacteraeota bacterium]